MNPLSANWLSSRVSLSGQPANIKKKHCYRLLYCFSFFQFCWLWDIFLYQWPWKQIFQSLIKWTRIFQATRQLEWRRRQYFTFSAATSKFAFHAHFSGRNSLSRQPVLNLAHGRRMRVSTGWTTPLHHTKATGGKGIFCSNKENIGDLYANNAICEFLCKPLAEVQTIDVENFWFVLGYASCLVFSINL